MEDLVSHDVDGFLAEEAEWLRYCDRGDSITRRVSDVLHSVDVLWLFIGEVLAWVEELSNSSRRLVGSKISGEGPLKTLMSFL